jgi:hypothetical protein
MGRIQVSDTIYRLDFKLLVDCVKTGEQLILHLVAPTKQEKAAWVTDIAQVTTLYMS